MTTKLDLCDAQALAQAILEAVQCGPINPKHDAKWAALRFADLSKTNHPEIPDSSFEHERACSEVDETEDMDAQDLSKCPKCGGPADNGHDHCIPPSPYYCTKCEIDPRDQRIADLEGALRAQETMIQAELEPLGCIAPFDNHAAEWAAEEIQVLRAKLEEKEKDSECLNKVGHTLGCCYCTDQGCFTAESEAIQKRAEELARLERERWDYEGACLERDDLRAKLAEAEKESADLRQQLNTMTYSNESHRKTMESWRGRAIVADELEKKLSAIEAAKAGDEAMPDVSHWVGYQVWGPRLEAWAESQQTAKAALKVEVERLTKELAETQDELKHAMSGDTWYLAADPKHIEKTIAQAKAEERERCAAIVSNPHNMIVWVCPEIGSIHADPRFIRAALGGE